MRTSALLLLICLCHCSKPGRIENKDDDAYGEYEIAEPEKSVTHGGPATHTVEIVQMKFVPEVLNIHEGDSVLWVNKDFVQHDVTELNTNLWQSPKLKPGESWKSVIKSSQVYNCSLHVIMKGKIIVDGKDIAMDLSTGVTMCNSLTNADTKLSFKD